MHKVSLALAVLGSTAALYAQSCNSTPPPQTIRTYDPWAASFYYGNLTGNTLNLMFDIDVQTPITINQINTVTYDQGAGNPVVPSQVGNVAECRIYLIPGTRTGNETTQANWGVANPASGMPEIYADLTVVAWNGDSPINNFHDANGNPMPFVIQPGQYGVCIEFIPTTYVGTPSAPNNPGSLHTIGVSPNPGITWSDQFLSISNDGICQNGWQTVDPSGNLIPNPTPNPAQDSINVELDYTPAASAAISVPFGTGCYDKPRMVYEQIPANTTPIDLVNLSYTWLYSPSASGGNYTIVGAGTPYDAATAAQNGTNILNMTPTSQSAGWDDGSLVWTLDATLFPTGFPFPGGSVTDITINSNGKIYLGNTVDNSFATNGANYGSTGPFQDLLPQVAPFYTDLDPTAGGAIYVEEPSPNGGIRITWSSVPNWPAVAGVTNDIQVELLPTGFMYWSYGANLANNGGGNDAIVGFSAGNGEPLSTPVDFSTLNGYVTGDGSVAPNLYIDGRPIINTSVDVVIDNLTAGTGAGLLSVTLASLPTPLSLGQFGMPGCDAYVDVLNPVFNVIVLPSPMGDLRWTWSVPAAANGVQVFFQAGTLTPNPYNTLGALATNALCAKVGT